MSHLPRYGLLIQPPFFLKGNIFPEKDSQIKKLNEVTGKELNFTLLKQEGNLVVCKTASKIIEVWDLVNKIALTFDSGLSIEHVTCNEDYLVTSNKSCVKVWELKTGLLKHQTDHSGNISDLQIYQCELLISSKGGELGFLNLQTYKWKKICNELDSKGLFFRNLIIVFSSEKEAIEIKNKDTEEIVATLQGEKGLNVAHLQDNYLICGYQKSAIIKIWNLDNYECKATLNPQLPSHYRVTALCMVKDKLIAGYLGGTIKIWDCQTFLCLNTLKCESNPSAAIAKIWASHYQIIAIDACGALYKWVF